LPGDLWIGGRCAGGALEVHADPVTVLPIDCAALGGGPFLNQIVMARRTTVTVSVTAPTTVTWSVQVRQGRKNLVLHGDWGPSVNETTDIGHELGHRVQVTARLVLLAMLVAVAFAVLSGVLSATRQYTRLDYVLTFLGFVFLAMPPFWVAQLLKNGAVAYNGATGSRLFSTIGERYGHLPGQVHRHPRPVRGAKATTPSSFRMTQVHPMDAHTLRRR